MSRFSAWVQRREIGHAPTSDLRLERRFETCATFRSPLLGQGPPSRPWLVGAQGRAAR